MAEYESHFRILAQYAERRYFRSAKREFIDVPFFGAPWLTTADDGQTHSFTVCWREASLARSTVNSKR